jgi:thiamine biosynthesis lipoprotein ApbE
MTEEAHKIVGELRDFEKEQKSGSVQEVNQSMAFLSARTSRLHVLLAEEQAKSAAKMEEQTARLIEETIELRRFTRGVFWLTVILAIVAVIQIFQVFCHN